MKTCLTISREFSSLRFPSLSIYNICRGGSWDDSNGNPICGKTVTAFYQGRSVTAQIRDICMGCDPTHIDMSPGAISVLDSNYQQDGQIDITWVMNFDYPGVNT
jgi:hypothetical protein